MDVFICPLVQKRGTDRLVFVFRVGEIPTADHQTRALRGENPCSRVGEIPQRRVSTPIGRSRKACGHVCLPSPSGRNPSSGTYKYFSEWGKSQQRRGLIIASEWGKSYLRGIWMYVCRRAILLSSPSRLSYFHLRGERRVVCYRCELQWRDIWLGE